MKSILRILLFCTVTLFFSTCDKNENSINTDTLSEFDKVELVRNFYDSSTNLAAPNNTNIKFSVSPVNTAGIEYLLDNVVENDILKQDVQTNFVNGLAIYHEGNESKIISNEDIFAFSIYDTDTKGQMIHSFYNKENGKFILKKKLMETFLNTENQNFLVWKYHKEKYAKEGVIVSRIFNLDNNSLTDRVNQTRSEFNLFRVRNKYPTNNQFKSSNAETAYIGVGLDACGYPQCGENGNGQCDGGWYCADNGDCPPCEDCEVKTMSVEQSLVSETVANALFDLDLHRNLRDQFLEKYTLGQKHIDYYYAISEFVLISDYNTSTFLQMVETLPSFNQSINKLLDDNTNGSEILLTQELSNDVVSILNDIKEISDNPDFQYIIDDFKNDVNLLTDKSKTDLVHSFQ